MDFINGLGLVFDVPLDEQVVQPPHSLFRRKWRIVGEPCQPLNGRAPLDFREDFYSKQLKGERIADVRPLMKINNSLLTIGRVGTISNFSN
jgi:hypothetical protein